MTEYNVYIVNLRSNKAAGLKETTFHVIPTEDDDRSRDELIFDYIIEADDDTGTTSS